jgi:ribosomal peptide maturation radical SAM protein 1
MPIVTEQPLSFAKKRSPECDFGSLATLQGAMRRETGPAGPIAPLVLRRHRDWPVALVAMPFVSPFHPSIQLGLLKALALARGFPSATFHLHLDLARQIGLEAYAAIGEMRGILFGDWLFAREAFFDRTPDPGRKLLDDFPSDVKRILDSAKMSVEQIVDLREQGIPAYLDRLIDTVPWERFRIIGFTCTFQQSAASFALARRIKARHPDVTLVFGGSNFEGEMGAELVRAVDAIDYAVIGEGDVTFPELLETLAANRDPAQVYGVAFRRADQVIVTPSRPPFETLDALPTPDYDEYFERVEELGILSRSGRRPVEIPFESARGCWWGAKHHCTFCGLNGKTMAFRAKTPERLVDELSALAGRYRSFRFTAVDNILDHRYLKTFLAKVVQASSDYEFFYEIKANLTREQVKALSDAGVRHVQPGIESLNTHVLRLMRKGISAAQNVNLLRWAHYYGIGAFWNILWGFPGETQADYDEMAMLLPHLMHLPPPTGASRIWMERFSPIFFDREAFPARYVRPERSYSYVYPADVCLEKMAYFFDYELEHRLPDEAYTEVSRSVTVWRKAWEAGEPPRLTFWAAPDLLQIEDLRNPEKPGIYNFRGTLASLYLACSDQPRSVTYLQKATMLDERDEAIELACEEFCHRGLMMRDGGQFLSLALPATKGR